MAEYKLSYTAAEIDEKLERVGALSEDVEQIETDINEINNVINNKADKEHSHSNMAGATTSADGTSGLVPAPVAGDESKYLRGDGTWAEVESGGADGIIATLSASGWTEQSDGSYAQTVSVSGVTVDNQVVVDVALSGSDMDADIEVLKVWGYVNRASQAVDSLTFYCYGDVPTVSIPLNVVVM